MRFERCLSHFCLGLFGFGAPSQKGPFFREIRVMTYRGATLRLSMMICLMSGSPLRRLSAAVEPPEPRNYQLIPPKSPRYDRSGDREVAVCLSPLLLLRSL
jgi:hypothetical protein